MVAYGLVLALGFAIFTIAIANMLANKVKVFAKLYNVLSILIDIFKFYTEP